MVEVLVMSEGPSFKPCNLFSLSWWLQVKDPEHYLYILVFLCYECESGSFWWGCNCCSFCGFDLVYVETSLNRVVADSFLRWILSVEVENWLALLITVWLVVQLIGFVTTFVVPLIRKKYGQAWDSGPYILWFMILIFRGEFQVHFRTQERDRTPSRRFLSQNNTLQGI